MRCPKCSGDMETVTHDGFEIDRCKLCRGIWFDLGESEFLRYEDAARSIDTGNPEKGSETNDIDRYRCPRCGGGMMRRVDLRGKHVKYEECSSCRGTFFDAGEFADLVAGGRS